jgi:hypothetical protein
MNLMRHRHRGKRDGGHAGSSEWLIAAFKAACARITSSRAALQLSMTSPDQM